MDIDNTPNLAKELIEFLRDYSKIHNEYINPNFIMEITDALYDYYEIEDDEVNEWLESLYGQSEEYKQWLNEQEQYHEYYDKGIAP